MFIQLKNPNFYIIFFLDLILFSTAFFFAYLFRFEFILDRSMLNQMLQMLPLVLIVKAAAFFFMGLYKGMFRYVGISDSLKLFRGTVLSSLIIIAIILIMKRFQGYSRAVFLIDGVLTFLFTGGLRISIRFLFKEYMSKQENKSGFNMFKKNKDVMPVLIYGAGNSGEKLYREIVENPRLNYDIKGFGDDNKKKQGRAIHGVPVLGGVEQLSGIKEKHKIREVLIAMPSSTGQQMRRVVDECKACALPFKTLPGMGELINGKVSVKVLRDVSYKDLLRRKPVELDTDKISGYINDKIVLVTGAGGSIGSELCRQIIKFQPRQLVLLDVSEPNLYSIQMELKHRAGYQRYATVLGQIQDEDLIDGVMQRYQPQVIFHAAAYKHVPMLERNPWQAVSNNIRGNQVMLEKALEYGVGHFVLVSTDKAVRPTNIMGASKRVCELLVQSYMGNGTRMMAVRFGNVVGSSGSVIPLFREQIERGGPVTVTHPEVTRYFMTIPEASQLILQAGTQGQGGETFILEMGTPIKIADMARDLIRLSGKEPDDDIEIQFTGLRQGEKLYEELITEGEGIVPTPHEKIMVLKANGDWNGLGTQQAFRNQLLTQLNDLYTTALLHDVQGIRQKMKEIVPEYEVQNSTCVL
ncbi:polysaccharide biosynthesis protein [Desulfobacula toluolica]|uniref:Polysaccharide biosynthesis protein n=1 Tax=Desulfobacula toluolica (strain DSM 7467 / Tol2) TaxID=651182 RepID=K0NGL1_DESTT|nr:nucleoside-diphosphate sugar epimerase/dehydratase [Desulfobacula toluolica]CCK78973.1 polysaccharide biosynthesis protein [Desulfobacula toluolica Tol2]